LSGTDEFEQLITYSKPERTAGLARSASIQALMQFLALLVTLAISGVGGLIVGVLIKWRFFSPLSTSQVLKEHKIYWDNMTQVKEHLLVDSNVREMEQFNRQSKLQISSVIEKPESLSFDQENVLASSSSRLSTD
jgi:hypothetical protein